jgi:hypothetical protein
MFFRNLLAPVAHLDCELLRGGLTQGSCINGFEAAAPR